MKLYHIVACIINEANAQLIGNMVATCITEGKYSSEILVNRARDTIVFKVWCRDDKDFNQIQAKLEPELEAIQ